MTLQNDVRGTGLWDRVWPRICNRELVFEKQILAPNLKWASLVAQSVKNPPAMQRPRFNPWARKVVSTHSSILVWRLPMDLGSLRAAAQGIAKSQKRLTTAQNNLK